jgi:hypothetical protein
MDLAFLHTAITATSAGVSPRLLTVSLASALVGLVGGCLTYVMKAGRLKPRLAAAVIAGFVAFPVAYTFIDHQVADDQSVTTSHTPTRLCPPAR